MIELLNRGHDVTFLTSNSMMHMNLSRYTEILVEPRFPIETVSKLTRFVLSGDIWNNQANRNEMNNLFFNVQVSQEALTEQQSSFRTVFRAAFDVR